MDFISLLQKYEEIRKSLEMCSIEKDVDFFVNLRKTGSLAPGKSLVESQKVVLSALYCSWSWLLWSASFCVQETFILHFIH